jgi:hypothetical protein
MDATGGSAAMCWATAAGTPWWRSPAVSVPGSVLASPVIMSEKKMPMDSAVPEFWKVARMPEATPRCRAGTLPMMEAEFGAANIPAPIPFRAMRAAKAPYGKLTGSIRSPMKLAPNTSMPALPMPRVPSRSDR